MKLYREDERVWRLEIGDITILLTYNELEELNSLTKTEIDLALGLEDTYKEEIDDGKALN